MERAPPPVNKKVALSERHTDFIFAHLNVLKSVIAGLQEVQSAERKLITAAASRIEAIANDLISKFTGTNSEDGPVVSLVASVVESITAESRVLLGENPSIEVRNLIPTDLTTATVPISAARLSRVLSNLINNSIDALQGTSEGLINIVVSARTERVTISITDNGKGIPSELNFTLRY